MGLPQGEKCGYLHIKVPAKVRGKGVKGWKAWKRKWVVVHAMTVQSTKTPIVTIDVYASENRQGQTERSTVYLEKVSVIRRTLSKSHVYAFIVETEMEPLIYLAGRSETDSQSWIAALRNIFWPPTMRSLVGGGGGIGSMFSVSIIESLSSYMVNGESGELSETVGYMMVLPSVILLTSLASRSILIEWPWLVMHGVTLINTDTDEDKGKIILIHIICESPSSGLYYFFCENASDIYQILTSKLEEYEKEEDYDESISNARMLSRNSSVLKRHQSVMRSRKLSLDSLASRKPWKTTAASAATTTASSGSTDEETTSNVFTKSQSLNSVTNDDNCAEEPEIEVQLRRKPHPKVHLCSSYDLLPNRPRISPPTKSPFDKRRSSSDSNLLSEPRHCDDHRQKALSIAIDEKRSIVKVENNKISNTPMNECKLENQLVKDDVNDRPTSVHSSVSQMSRDSGVMMSTVDDSPAKTHINKRRTLESGGTKQFYRPFSEFVDDRAMQMSASKQATPSSSSSEGTLYSEIDHAPREDPLYEDLDKFRKNLEKLLGMQQSEPPKTPESGTKQLPPPLPPRQYERGRPQTPINPVQLHRKDVMKYLGVVDDKKYGSLNRLPTNYSAKQKRKDIHSYLGIASATDKLKTGSHSSLVELTYDIPKPSFDLIKTDEANRRISRTYVRVRKPDAESVYFAPPSPKPAKKKRLKFPKWRRSTMMKEHYRPEEETYKSFEKDDCDSVFPEDANQVTAMEGIFVEEEILAPAEVSQTDLEQYSVPRSRKSPIILDVCQNYQYLQSKDPHYANVEEIRMETESNVERKTRLIVPIIDVTPTFIDENDEENETTDHLIEEEEYADMSMRVPLPRGHSVYITMNSENKTIQSVDQMTDKNLQILDGNGSQADVDADSIYEIQNVESEMLLKTDDIRSDVSNDLIIDFSEEVETAATVDVCNSDPEDESVKCTKETETQTSIVSDIDREVIKRMIFECNPKGERLRQRLSSYIDEIFAESLMEYDSRRSSNISASSSKSLQSENDKRNNIQENRY